MSAKQKYYDVFLSYSMEDTALAETIRRSFVQTGLDVFDYTLQKAGKSLAETIWSALAVSEALVAVIPSNGELTSNAAAELGAAMAWSKPIYLIRQANVRTRTPSFLKKFEVFDVTRLSDLVIAIRSGQRPLSPKRLEVLQELYAKMETPTDQYIQDPVLLENFARRFRARTRSKLTGERLLSEMIRLRKRGQWPRIGKIGASRIEPRPSGIRPQAKSQ